MCATHPEYTGERKPFSNCCLCWEVWLDAQRQPYEDALASVTYHASEARVTGREGAAVRG
jgi:hypothetical protein